jgi:hypothetical protein
MFGYIEIFHNRQRRHSSREHVTMRFPEDRAYDTASNARSD